MMSDFAPGGSPRRKRILLVDDEEAVRKVVGKRLELEGFEVLTAADGEEALAKAKQERPDLIVLDLMLPRRNGFEVCAELKGDPAYRRIPIIIFTGQGGYGDAQLSGKYGADRYLPKSEVAARLVSHIRVLLSRQEG